MTGRTSASLEDPKYLHPRGQAVPVEVPESLGYRLKNRLLGPPLGTDQLAHERLGKPTALAVFRVRQLVVVGVRDRRDLEGPHPRRRRRRVRVGRADHDRAAGGLGVLDPLVPPDDQGLPHGGRRLHRDPRQLRAAPCAGRRCLAADRLHPDGLGLGRRGHRGDRVGLPEPRSVRRADLGVVHRADRVRQPARRQGIRSTVRRSDLLLHPRHGDPPRIRRVPHGVHVSAGRTRPQGRVGGIRPRGKRTLDGRRALQGLDRVRERRRGRDRSGGDLERCPGVSGAGMEERSRDARHHGFRARRDVPRTLDPRREDARRSVREGNANRHLPDRQARLRQLGRWNRVVLRSASGNRAHLDPRGKHELRRLPPPGEFPRRRQLHASAADEARAPARLLERHHLPRRRLGRARRRLRRQGRQPHRALRHRSVHQLHHVAIRYGEASHHPQGAGLANRALHQRDRRVPVVRRHRRSSRSPSSRAAPGSSSSSCRCWSPCSCA